MQQIRFSSLAYQGLALFVHRERNCFEASFTLSSGRGSSEAKILKATSGYIHFALLEKEDYLLSCEGGVVDLAYLDCGPHMLEDGVFPVYGDGNRLLGRNRIHFSPMEGWMNDPNGLCVFQGKMHLFYQYNPFSQQWGNMHWGHAVTDDLVHWTQEPVAFFPQPELQDAVGLRGGAFSGSAIADGSLSVFFTRNVGDTDRTWRKEEQVTAKSQDGINFSHEHTVLKPHLEHGSGDFRDPKVLPYANGFLMVVGSCINERPTVLLYSSANLETWNFVSMLYVETDSKYAVAECPDFFLLDGKWVLLVGFINKDRSPIRDVKYLIGSFDGKTFTPEHSGLLDEGKDFYATQTVEWKKRRILFGWNSDTRGVYVPSLHGANGTLSLPRELSIQNDRLIQKPAEEIGLLQRKETACQGEPYRLRVFGSPITRFQSVLAGNRKGVSLIYQNKRLSLFFCNTERCVLDVSRLESLDIFVDTALVEIFVNEGQRMLSVRYGDVGKIKNEPISTFVEGLSTKVESHALTSIWE